MIDSIHFYRVNDLNKARDFYTNVLNLSLWKDQKKCLIFDVHGQGKIGFCEHFPENAQASGCITFVYDSKKEVDAWYNRFTSFGYDIVSPIENEFFNIYHFFIQDPNGLTLEFQVFLSK